MHKRILETHMAGISPPYNLPNLSSPEEVQFTADSAEFYRDYLPSGRDPYEPLSELYYVSALLVAQRLQVRHMKLSSNPHCLSFSLFVGSSPYLTQPTLFRFRTQWIIPCEDSLA
jgi:hypothetical protein